MDVDSYLVDYILEVMDVFEENIRQSTSIISSLGNISLDIATDSIDFSNSNQSAINLNNTLDNIKSVMQDISRMNNIDDFMNFSQSNESLRQLGSDIKVFGSNVKNSMKSIFNMDNAKKAYDFFKDTTEAYSDYDLNLRHAVSLMEGDPKQNLERTDKMITRLSEELVVDSSELVNIFRQAMSIGIEEPNIEPFLRQASKMSVGGNVDMNTSSQLLATVTNTYSEDNLSYEKASDILFKTANNSKAELKDLSRCLYNVMDVAEDAGVSFENLGAGIATMTADGTPSRVATNNLKKALMELSKEGNKANDVFRGIVGIDFNEFMESEQSFSSAFEILDEYAKANDYSITELFDSNEAGIAALSLSGQNSKRFRKNEYEITNSAGTTDNSYDLMNDSYDARIAQLTNKLMLFKRAIGSNEGIKSGLDRLIQKIVEFESNGTIERLTDGIGQAFSSLVNGFVSVLEDTDSIIATFTKGIKFIGDNLSTVLNIVKYATYAFLIFKGVMMISAVVESLATAFAILAPALGFVTAKQMALNVAMYANPIGIVIGLVLVLVSVLIILSKKFGGIKKVLFGFFKFFVGGFFHLYEFFFGWISNMIGSWMNFLDKFGLIGDVIKSLIAPIKKFFDWLGSLFGNVGDKIDEISDKATKEDHKRNKKKTVIESQTKEDLPKENMDEYLKKLDKDKENFDLNMDYKLQPNSAQERTINNDIDDIEAKYGYKKDLYDSQLSLAEKKNDKKSANKIRQSLINQLKLQSKDLLDLSVGKTNKDYSIVQTARNKIMLKILDITEGIKGGVDKLIGEFNKPSGITALTKYKYDVSNSTSTMSKMISYSPNVTMTLNIKDLDKESANTVKDKMLKFSDYIFGKDDIVNIGMNDITRN